MSMLLTAQRYAWIAKHSLRIYQPYEEDEPFQIWQEFGNVNDREMEKVGEGATFDAAIDAAIESERSRRAAVSTTEIADALHGSKPRTTFELPIRVRALGQRNWTPSTAIITADDRADARWQINHGVIIASLRARGCTVRYDVRNLRITKPEKARRPDSFRKA